MKAGRVTALAVILAALLGTAACGKTDAAGSESETTAAASAVSVTESETTQATEAETTAPETSVTETSETETEAAKTMIMKIGNKALDVTWEDNASVEELKELAKNGLTIQMSMYGGFEQVGPIGQSIASDDEQTTTEAGDIVLYSGDQIVIFYGSNSWAYTRLGHVNLSQEEMADLLGNGDVVLTIQK